MTPNNPTPDAMVLVPLYYMRDNHTFRRLSDNPTAALAEVMEEFDAGWSHGMLCTKRPGEAGTLHVHGGGPGRKFEFEADAAAWLERQRVLAAPPAEPAEPSVPANYQSPTNPGEIGSKAESVPAEGVTDAMVEAALKARVPGGAQVKDWLPSADTYGREPHQTTRNVMRAALTAALAPLLDDRDQWRNTAQLAEAENERLRAAVEVWSVLAKKRGDEREAAEHDARALRALLTEARDYVNQAVRDEASLNRGLVTPRTTEARFLARIDAALATPSGAADSGSFQARVQPWMLDCFGAEVAADRLERNDRFIEEALELLQATGYPRERVASLVEYVYRRPVGEPSQEVGGVMVTLAALCLAHGLDMHSAGETELTRILRPEVVAKIRAKQAAKPKGSALPGAPDSGEAKWLATSEDGTMFAAIAASTEGEGS